MKTRGKIDISSAKYEKVNKQSYVYCKLTSLYQQAG